MTNIENDMRPIHPGEVLREEFLVPLGMSAHALAIGLQVPAPRINDIVRERRTVTADTALRLAKFFGTRAEFWTGLQADYDTACARIKLTDVLPRIKRFSPDISWGFVTRGRKGAWLQGARREGDKGILDNTRRPNKRNAVDMPYCAPAVDIP